MPVTQAQSISQIVTRTGDLHLDLHQDFAGESAYGGGTIQVLDQEDRTIEHQTIDVPDDLGEITHQELLDFVTSIAAVPDNERGGYMVQWLYEEFRKTLNAQILGV